MTSSLDPSSDPPPDASAARPAATVMLVRDRPGGLEVFMLRRTLSAAFAGGMYVFPGGRVDAADAADELEGICDGLDDTAASALLGVDAGGLAYWVAAIRECFEEAGVLLARPRGSTDVVRFEQQDVIDRFATARHAVHQGERSLVGLCRDEALVLVTDAIHYVSHWITPHGEGRRFDTRFFVARAPAAQEPLHDDGETIESLWVRPADALDQQRNGELALLPPTIRNLEFLAAHDSTDAVLDAAARVGTPPMILPKLVLDDAGKFVDLVFPWDADYAATPHARDR